MCTDVRDATNIFRRNFSSLKHFLFVSDCHFSWNLSSLLSFFIFTRRFVFLQKAFKNIHEAASYAIKAHLKIKAWCVVIDCYSNSTLMLLTKLIIASQFAFFCSAIGGIVLSHKRLRWSERNVLCNFSDEESLGTWCVKVSANFSKIFWCSFGRSENCFAQMFANILYTMFSCRYVNCAIVIAFKSRGRLRVRRE